MNHQPVEIKNPNNIETPAINTSLGLKEKAAKIIPKAAASGTFVIFNPEDTPMRNVAKAIIFMFLEFLTIRYIPRRNGTDAQSSANVRPVSINIIGVVNV